MNIIIDNISHKLIKTEESESYIEYDVYRAEVLIGHIAKSGAEIYYTGRDTEGNIKSTAATLRDTLAEMVLNMFYTSTFKGDRHIITLGAWLEGSELKVEYVKNDYVKHVKRVVHYSKDAGDLYIVLDNNRYFLHEFS